MGQTGFCKNLRFSAVFCENLRFPAVFCENLRLQNAVIPRKSENQQKSAKISETAKISAFVPFSLSLLVPPNQRAENGGLDPSWLNLALWGRPKNAKFNHDGSNPPFSAL